MEHLGGEGSIAGTSSVVPSTGGDEEAAAAPMSPQFSSIGPTIAEEEDPPASPPTASEVGQAAVAANLEPLDELEGQLADVSAVLSSPNGSEHGASGARAGAAGAAERGLSPTSMASQSDASVSASSAASQQVPAGGVFDTGNYDDDGGDGLMQFPIERRVPTFDLDDEDETDAQQLHRYPASPDEDDASHSTATADETDLMGLFSGDRGMERGTAAGTGAHVHESHAVPASNGRIDPDTSGLRLDLDGLSGYDPHPPPSSSSPDSRTKWDEARLTKSSSGGYPAQTLASASRPPPQDVGAEPSNQQNQNQNNLPDFVRKAQQRQQQEDARLQSDSLTPTHANSKDGQQQRRRPRPWDDLNETSVHDDTYEDYEDDAANVAENGYVTLAMQHQRDGSVPPNNLQEQPKESTPLLSNQRRRHMGNGSDNTDGGSSSHVNGSSWSSVGASMRFRNPLQSRRSATPVSHNGSGSGSGSGNYAASAIASTVHTDATMSTLTSRFKWRPGGDLTAHADHNDDDAQSWTAGSVVKEFVRPLWNRDREDSNDGIGRSASFAYALTNRPQSRASFSFGLAVLCCLHFGSMVVFDLYYLYFNWSTGTDGPSAWLSSGGFVANPLIGPPASTLTYFGALSGIRLLLSSEIWRVLTSLALSTSIIQLALHLIVLRFGTFKGYIAGLERRWSSKATLALYLICSFCGSVCSVAMDYPANLTGLVSAGLCGLLSASLAEGWLSSVREMRSDRLGYSHDGSSESYGRDARSSLAKILLRPGKAHYYIVLELVTSVFAHSSLWAVTGGLLSGLGCGLFHFSYLLDNRDLRPKSQAYGPSFSTPSKKRHMFGTPPHSPSPSETPPMRRSMMATPEQDENGFGDASSPYRSPSRNNSHFVSTPSNEEMPPTKSGVGTTRLVGFLLALLVGIIPGALVATGAVGEAWGGTLDDNLLLESSYGCRSMRRLFEASVMSESEYAGVEDVDEANEPNESEDLWVCSQSCVPLTLVARAGRSMNRNGLSMKSGRCKAQGYICQVGAGSQELHSGRWFIPKALSDPVYDLPMNIYAMPGEDETCSDESDAGTDAEEEAYAENGDDAGAVANEGAGNEDGQNQNIEAQENEMQATASGNARTSVSIQDIVIDIAEEAVVNAGL